MKNRKTGDTSGNFNNVIGDENFPPPSELISVVSNSNCERNTSHPIFAAKSVKMLTIRILRRRLCDGVLKPFKENKKAIFSRLTTAPRCDIIMQSFNNVCVFGYGFLAASECVLTSERWETAL